MKPIETIKELKNICQSSKMKNRSMSDWGYLKHRALSIYITKIILKLVGRKIKPNHISIFNIFFGILILLLTASNTIPLALLLLLFYFSFLLDKVDGEIARYKNIITLRGAYLDEIYHLFVQNGFVLAVSINRFLMKGEKVFLFLGVVGFILFFLSRYIRKVRYFIYAKSRPETGELLTKQELGRFEKLLVNFLNIFPLKLCSISRRHDVFLFLAFVLSIFCLTSIKVWFWFLMIWVAMLTIYVLRFLFLNYLFIDRDVKLIDENKL